jgi:hypothetical protein
MEPSPHPVFFGSTAQPTPAKIIIIDSITNVTTTGFFIFPSLDSFDGAAKLIYTAGPEKESSNILIMHCASSSRGATFVNKAEVGNFPLGLPEKYKA